MFSNNVSTFLLRENWNLLLSLEDRRLNILEVEEESWSLKRKAIGIAQGDQNTRFFLKFTNHRRINNTI